MSQAVALRAEWKLVSRPAPSLSAKAPKQMEVAASPFAAAFSPPPIMSWPSLSAGETFS